MLSSQSHAHDYASAPARTIDHVVVPGTFDPITLGHLDVILRAHRMFPRVTVAVACSANKNGCGTVFSLDERVRMVQESLHEADVHDITVLPFEGLLVNFCCTHKAEGVVKGLRAMTDFEYELQQADLNWRMAKNLESIFVMSNPKYGYVSSSIVREIVRMGADVTSMVPHAVLAHLDKLRLQQ
ncbi:pantetheine-phosphate adenylyltransferase [Fannyhessea vaginae]|nr:pantetheine-phosphate adenylyltransferase [Fannyhessea vaginae]